jgi:hypothetical protein
MNSSAVSWSFVEMMNNIPRDAIRLDAAPHKLRAPHATRFGNPCNLTMDLDSDKPLILWFLESFEYRALFLIWD